MVIPDWTSAFASPITQTMRCWPNQQVDGSAVECDDDEGEGYAPRYGRS